MTWAQMKQYRAMVAKAAKERGLPPGKQTEKYRLEVLFEETGLRSSLDVKSQRDYEAIMRRHAADANDWESAAYYCGGDEQRMGAMANDCARQIIELSGKQGSDAALYVHDVLRAGGFVWASTDAEPSNWWKDCSPDTVRMIFCILDKHRRRLLHRRRLRHLLRSWNDKERVAVAADAPMRYRFGASWRREN